MTLSNFIKTYICPNTVLRLWVETHEGHRMLNRPGEEVCMEWSVLNGSSWAADYADWLVIGVTDILCETHREAVNIVITNPFSTMKNK